MCPRGGEGLAVFGDLVGLTSGFETSQLELTVGGSAPKLNLPGNDRRRRSC